MKKKIFSYFFFIFIFLIIAFITFKFDKDILKNNNLTYKKCSDLNYKESLHLHPDNFKSIKLNMKILDYREWSQILFEEEVLAKAAQLKFSSDIKVYSNRKRVKAIFEVNIDSKIKCSLLANIRPHGDLEDHRSSSSLPSLNVNITDGHLFGIVKFILFKPKTRNYDNEILASTLLKELNFLAPRTANFDISHNKKIFKFIFQEKVEKEFIENNSKIENPIYKGDERFTFIDRQRFAIEKTIFNHIFKPVNKNFISKDQNQKFLTEVGLSILNELALYYKGDVDEDDNFDFYSAGKKAGYNKNFDNFATFDALLLSMNADHGLPPGNRRIYFDPVYKKFHPIYYDGMASLLGKNNDYVKQTVVKGINLKFKSKKNKIYRPGMFNGKAIISGVIGADKALELITKIDRKKLKAKLKLNGVTISDVQLEKTLIGIDENLNILKNFKKDKIFQFKENLIPSIYIKSDFDYKNALKKISYKKNLNRRLVFYTENPNEFTSCDIYNETCRILEIKKKDISKLISQEYVDKENSQLIFIGKKKNNSLFDGWLGKKEPKLLKEFVNFNNNVLNLKIKIAGDIDLQINEKSKIISIIKNDEHGRVVFYDGFLKNWKIDFTDNINDNILQVEKRKDKNGLTGCLSFVDLLIENVSMSSSNASCEDAINFIRSKGKTINITAKNSKADSLDADFSELKFNIIRINGSLNDCLDFSYGNYELNSVKLNNCGDKAISAGENSYLKIKDLKATNVNTGVAAKDFSKVEINHSLIDNSKICYESYNKKQEFSGAYLFVKNSKCINSNQENYKDDHSIIQYGIL